MRGEHESAVAGRVPDEGSSPHARGTHSGLECGNIVIGIIPACAGNTCIYVFFLPAHGDHPRMRGEHVPLSLSRASG